MKARTLAGIVLLTLVALVLSAPAVGQTDIHWKIFLSGPVADTFATAEYDVLLATAEPPSTGRGIVMVKRFTVEAVTPRLPDGIRLGVFLGPAIDPKDPYGKLVGVIEIKGGIGAMALLTADCPTVRQGTSVTLTSVDTPGQVLFLSGKF